MKAWGKKSSNKFCWNPKPYSYSSSATCPNHVLPWEVETGLGPTLEFYTLLSHKLQKEKLEMWRTEMRLKSESGVDVEMAVAEERGEAEVASNSLDYVNAPQGLFSRPWHLKTDASSNKKYGKVLEHFRLLGRVMAKALQDGRLLDVPLSTTLYKIVLGQELDLYDIETLDPKLGWTLFEMQVLVRRKLFLEASEQAAPERLLVPSKLVLSC